MQAQAAGPQRPSEAPCLLSRALHALPPADSPAVHRLPSQAGLADAVLVMYGQQGTPHVPAVSAAMTAAQSALVPTPEQGGPWRKEPLHLVFRAPHDCAALAVTLPAVL